MGDILVVEPGQNAALLAKAPFDLSRYQAGPDQLDGDLLVVEIVGPLSQIDHAHSPAANLINNAIWADHTSDGLETIFNDSDGRKIDGERFFQKTGGFLMVMQHLENVHTNEIFPTASRGEKLRSR